MMKKTVKKIIAMLLMGTMLLTLCSCSMILGKVGEIKDNIFGGDANDDTEGNSAALFEAFQNQMGLGEPSASVPDVDENVDDYDVEDDYDVDIEDDYDADVEDGAEDDLIGIMIGDTYTNDYFDFGFTLEGWKVARQDTESIAFEHPNGATNINMHCQAYPAGSDKEFCERNETELLESMTEDLAATYKNSGLSVKSNTVENVFWKNDSVPAIVLECEMEGVELAIVQFFVFADDHLACVTITDFSVVDCKSICGNFYEL